MQNRTLPVSSLNDAQLFIHVQQCFVKREEVPLYLWEREQREEDQFVHLGDMRGVGR